ncbi:hypothetical protein BUALT_Bualt18G0090000 [Buddleja alternifolia]|uniref:Uncharacterized protein n=1 Tax=Buddleja alternifolia TaxID=168488 RepID=A0AAV6W5C7_9LAMI|nr:hypothetical protein BUALT_Bualt18G0090000 [Buddleja alternifolia]
MKHTTLENLFLQPHLIFQKSTSTQSLTSFDDWDRDNLVDLDAESTADENNSEFVYYMSQQQLHEMTLVREEIAQHLWTDIGRG